MMNRFDAFNVRIEALLGVQWFKIVRFLVAGGTAVVCNVFILFALVQFGDLHYLHASIAAFIISTVVSFVMQKFLTFRDTLLHDVHAQFTRYLIVVLANLLLNTVLVYVFVEKAGMWYLVAQLLATIVIAFTGYFGYQHFVFRERTSP